MANALNRTTKEYKTSVNTPEYPTVDWIINPDTSAVVGFDTKYWIVTGDIVTLMEQTDRDAVDAAELVELLDSLSDQIDAPVSYHRAFAEILIDEFNDTYTIINGILDAIDNANNLASIQNAVALLANRPTRTLSQLKTSLRSKLDG